MFTTIATGSFDPGTDELQTVKAPVRIELVIADAREATYGIYLKSRAPSLVRTAPGDRRIHNHGAPHQVEVWDNSSRAQPDGSFMSPSLHPTPDRFTFMLSAVSSVIDGRSSARGPELVTSDLVLLVWPDGVERLFEIVSPHALHDPVLVGI